MIGTGKDQEITTMYGPIALTTLMYVMHAQLWNPGSGWVGNNDGAILPPVRAQASFAQPLCRLNRSQTLRLPRCLTQVGIAYLI
jgi:hypothetical protein